MRSALVLALAGHASAHFKLLHPESFHYRDATQAQGPCGGRAPDFPDDDDDLFQYHIGGEDIATVLSHERSDWLIRVTTDHDASGDWEQVFPIYTQSGYGSFCQPRVAIPDKYEGKTGIVSVVSAATDGILYQCILAKFVSGTGDDSGECSNGTANGYFSSNDRLSALVDGDSGDSNSGSNGSATTSSGGPSATGDDDQDDDDDGAMSLQAWGFLSSLMTVTAMAIVSGAFLV